MNLSFILNLDLGVVPELNNSWIIQQKALLTIGCTITRISGFWRPADVKFSSAALTPWVLKIRAWFLRKQESTRRDLLKSGLKIEKASRQMFRLRRGGLKPAGSLGPGRSSATALLRPGRAVRRASAPHVEGECDYALYKTGLIEQS